MPKAVLTASLLALVGVSHAHVADVPLAQHVAEHAWLVLAVVSLLAVIIPWAMRRR